MRLDLYRNPSSKQVLDALGLKETEIERFRGCGVDDGKIIIHCRTGGGNREYYPNNALVSNKYYLYDKDDDWDSTYADYYFRIPEEQEKELLKTEDKVAKAALGDTSLYIDAVIGGKKEAQDKIKSRIDKAVEESSQPLDCKLIGEAKDFRE